MCSEIPRSPCATIRDGIFGKPAKTQDKLGDITWLMCSVALVVIGALSISGVLPIGVIGGSIMTGIGGLALSGFLLVGVVSLILRGVYVGGMSAAHQN